MRNMRSGAWDNVPISITVPERRRRGHALDHEPAFIPVAPIAPHQTPARTEDRVAPGAGVRARDRSSTVFHVFFIGNP